MSKNTAEPVNGSSGEIDGVEITEDVIARLVKNAEVRLSESELEAVMARANREHRSRSDAIREALDEWAHA